jgi:hypothetical protein
MVTGRIAGIVRTWSTLWSCPTGKKKLKRKLYFELANIKRQTLSTIGMARPSLEEMHGEEEYQDPDSGR